jgi:hypothetical protein
LVAVELGDARHVTENVPPFEGLALGMTAHVRTGQELVGPLTLLRSVSWSRIFEIPPPLKCEMALDALLADVNETPQLLLASHAEFTGDQRRLERCEALWIAAEGKGAMKTWATCHPVLAEARFSPGAILARTLAVRPAMGCVYFPAWSDSVRVTRKDDELIVRVREDGLELTIRHKGGQNGLAEFSAKTKEMNRWKIHYISSTSSIDTIMTQKEDYKSDVLISLLLTEDSLSDATSFRIFFQTP